MLSLEFNTLCKDYIAYINLLSYSVCLLWHHRAKACHKQKCATSEGANMNFANKSEVFSSGFFSKTSLL
jgi:hypothetical protein